MKLFLTLAFSALALAQSITRVTAEIATPTPKGWTLTHTPAGNPTCRLNGLTLSIPGDFTVVGNALVSPYWSAVIDASDVLACDYTYRGT